MKRTLTTATGPSTELFGPVRIAQDSIAVLTALPLDEMLQLCQAIGVEAGLIPDGVHPFGTYTDLYFASTIVLQPRSVVIRVSSDPASVTELQRLRAEASDRGFADYLLLSIRPPSDIAVAGSQNVMELSVFADLCRQSAIVDWNGGRPTVRRAAYSAARQWGASDGDLDVLGLRWLAGLASNRLPWSLRSSTVPADEWFEKITFRIATKIFRLDGIRFGSAARGQRVGDALLWTRDRLVLLDCKAANSGYKLGIDDERRLIEYARGRYPSYCVSETIDYVVLISSGFPTFDADPRRFAERRARFRAAGSDLVCIRADHVIEAAVAMLDISADDSRVPYAMNWLPVLRQGMVTRERLLRQVHAARRRT